MPPSVSASRLAASTSSTIRALASGSPQRSGSASTRSASSGRGTQRHPVPQATDDLDLVLLEGHPGAAAVPQPAPGQLVSDLRAGHLYPGRYPFQQRDEGGAMRLPSGQPAQHDRQSDTPYRPAGGAPQLSRPSRSDGSRRISSASRAAVSSEVSPAW